MLVPMYENLATKYRPKTLSDLMGQEAVKTTLTNAVKLNRVGHSYVFYGPRGCGKTTVARILAKTLNCHNPGPDGSPCGECSSCKEIAESKSLDVIEIDAASNTAVDNVRSVIVDQVNFAPSRDKYKIYILDEVHMLSKGSFNALLKTLEEPPSHVVFIMATTEQEKVPVTILSRSQCFRFKFIPENEIAERIRFVCAQEKLNIDDGSVRLITRASGGAMRDALTLLDRAASFCGNDINVSILNELLGRPNEELLQQLALALINRDAAALHSAFDMMISGGNDVMAAMRELRNMVSDAFFAKAGFSSGECPIRNLPENISPGLLARLSRKLTVLIREIQYSDMQAVSAETGLYTLIEIPQDLGSLVRRLEELEARLEDPTLARSVPVKKKDNVITSPAATDIAVKSPSENKDNPANSVSLPENSTENVNSADFAEAWRRTLARISADRPLIYDSLADCRIRHEGGSVILIAKNRFFANRISYSLAELGEIMTGIIGRRMDFTVTYNQSTGADATVAAKPAIREKTPEKPPERPSARSFPSPTRTPPARPAQDTVSAVPQEGRALSESRPEPSTGGNSQKQNLRHEAAKLEFVPPEEIPAEFSALREVFGQGITRVNKVL